MSIQQTNKNIELYLRFLKNKTVLFCSQTTDEKQYIIYFQNMRYIFYSVINHSQVFEVRANKKNAKKYY